MTRNQLNITVGSDVILNVTLVHEEETLIPALIDNLEANLISGLGTRTALETGLGADYITIAIPWVEGRLAGCYSLEVKGSINGFAWAAIGKWLIRYTNATEAGADSVTVEADAYDVTMEAGYHWTDSPIVGVTATIDDQVGTPIVDVSYVRKVLGLDFHNLKGETGERGHKGEKGAQGDSFQPIEDVSGLMLAHVLGQDNTKAMSQKGVTDEVMFQIKVPFSLGKQQIVNGWIASDEWVVGDIPRQSYIIERDNEWKSINVTANPNYGTTIAFLDDGYTIPIDGDGSHFISTFAVLKEEAGEVVIPDTCAYIAVNISPNANEQNVSRVPTSFVLYKWESAKDAAEKLLEKMEHSITRPFALNVLSANNDRTSNFSSDLGMTKGNKYRIKLTASINMPSDVILFLQDNTTWGGADASHRVGTGVTISAGSNQSDWVVYEPIADAYKYAVLYFSANTTATFNLQIERYSDLPSVIEEQPRIIKDLNDLEGVCLAAWFTDSSTYISDHTRSCMSYGVESNGLKGALITITANDYHAGLIFFTDSHITSVSEGTNIQYSGLIKSYQIYKGTSQTIAVPDGAEGMIINATPGNFVIDSSYNNLYFPKGGKVYLAQHKESYNICKTPKFIPFGRIWTNTAANVQTAHQPYDSSGNLTGVCIIRTRHQGALGKYYMYYGYDHRYSAGNNVGIKLAYSDDLRNWILYGNVMKAKDAFGTTNDQETENPWVVWDDRNERYIMYWHSTYDYEGTGYQQTEYISVSDDGIQWTYVKPALTVDISKIVGDGHDGYWTVRKRNGCYYAGLLLGGTSNSTGGMAISIDGLKWALTRQIIGGFGAMFSLGGTSVVNDKESASGSQSQSCCFVFNGKYYRLSAFGTAAAGTAAKNTNIGITETFSDYFTPVSATQVIHTMNSLSGETTNIRDFSEFIDDDGSVYVVYVCANNALTVSDVFLAKIIFE